MKVNEALKELQAHVEKHSNNKYQNSLMESDDALRQPIFTLFTAKKYLTRYLAQEGEKNGDPVDLLKACHFILFEYQNKLGTQEEQPVNEPVPAEALFVNRCISEAVKNNEYIGMLIDGSDIETSMSYQQVTSCEACPLFTHIHKEVSVSLYSTMCIIVKVHLGLEQYYIEVRRLHPVGMNERTFVRYIDQLMRAYNECGDFRMILKDYSVTMNLSLHEKLYSIRDSKATRLLLTHDKVKVYELGNDTCLIEVDGKSQEERLKP